MNRVLVIIAITAFVSTLPAALGIWCYNCSSYEDPKCALLAKNDTDSEYYINCTRPNESFCRTTIITIVDSDRYVRVTRSCGFIPYRGTEDNCYETDDEFKFERSCQCFEDGCNSASSISLSILAFIVAAVCAAFGV